MLDIYFFTGRELTEEEWNNPFFEFISAGHYIGHLFGNHLLENATRIFQLFDNVIKSIVEWEHIAANEKLDSIINAIGQCNEQLGYFNSFNQLRFLVGIKSYLQTPSSRRREVIFQMVGKPDNWNAIIGEAIEIRKAFYQEAWSKLQSTYRLLNNIYSANDEVELLVRSPQVFLYELYLGLVETPGLLKFKNGTRESFMEDLFKLFGEVPEKTSKTRGNILLKSFPAENLEKIGRDGKKIIKGL